MPGGILCYHRMGKCECSWHVTDAAKYQSPEVSTVEVENHTLPLLTCLVYKLPFSTPISLSPPSPSHPPTHTSFSGLPSFPLPVPADFFQPPLHSSAPSALLNSLSSSFTLSHLFLSFTHFHGSFSLHHICPLVFVNPTNISFLNISPHLSLRLILSLHPLTPFSSGMV